jgi:hypothetical protein
MTFVPTHDSDLHKSLFYLDTQKRPIWVFCVLRSLLLVSKSSNSRKDSGHVLHFILTLDKQTVAVCIIYFIEVFFYSKYMLINNLCMHIRNNSSWRLLCFFFVIFNRRCIHKLRQIDGSLFCTTSKNCAEKGKTFTSDVKANTLAYFQQCFILSHG